MPVISTFDKTVSNWLKREFWAREGYCRKEVTINEASETELKTGTVLGKVTADGKYKVSVQDAVDGSENADAIFIGYGPEVEPTVTVPAATDTKIIVLIQGPAIVGKRELIFDASYDLDAEKQAAYDLLEAKGINVDNQV